MSFSQKPQAQSELKLSSIRRKIESFPISKESLCAMIHLCNTYLELNMIANAFSIQRSIDHYTKELSLSKSKEE